MKSREELIEELEIAKREQNRCMGGVDPSGCIAASKRISELRLALADGTLLYQHFARVMAQPKREKKRR